MNFMKLRGRTAPAGKEEQPKELTLTDPKNDSRGMVRVIGMKKSFGRGFIGVTIDPIETSNPIGIVTAVKYHPWGARYSVKVDSMVEKEGLIVTGKKLEPAQAALEKSKFCYMIPLLHAVAESMGEKTD